MIAKFHYALNITCQQLLSFQVSKMNSAIFNARPRDIHRYSIYKDIISFDFFALHPYHMKETFRPGRNHGEEYPSMKDHYKQFKNHVLDDKKPLSSNLQWTLLDYEKKNNLNFIHNPDITEIYCHNGLFIDLMTGKSEKYRCIKYNNKLFISNTSLRKNQDKLLSFIGARFETFLTNQRVPKHNKDHYKALLEGNWGKWNYKSVVEIDTYKLGEDGKKIEDMNEEERLKSYAEIKLCFAYDVKPQEVKQIESKDEFFTFLTKRVKSFKRKLEQWMFQSYFGRQDTLIIGVRNGLFELMCYEEIDMFDDLLPFVKKTYPKVYAKFLNSHDILERKLSQLYEGAFEGKVMEFTTSDRDLKMTPVNEKYVTAVDMLVPGILKGKNGDWQNDHSPMITTKRDERKDSQYIGESEAEEMKAKATKSRGRRKKSHKKREAGLEEELGKGSKEAMR